MKIAFIGGGNMGEVIASAILRQDLSTPRAVSISDVDQTRRQYLAETYGVYATGSNLEALDRGDVIILAIKPQHLVEVMAELSGQLKPSQLMLSIVAGARIQTLQNKLKHHSIVRVMPNTPAQISQGITVWTATAEVSEKQKVWASSILRTMGREIYVTDEKYLDMATAVSGSGPAYVFLFMESLVQAAVAIGLPQDIARELVFQTVLGSANFAQSSTDELNELRRMVTSPGGTTAEAIKIFEQGQFGELVRQAVVAAYNRARGLGD
ncbi:MAG: pyrroline-5-carboxylate reductase [Dehalococcoidales bacterium]|jgi:pyrroline-5-carboxylate reductase|nr:pyrroline-5-carboxylate reductase [Dehalococcoidales bacterium]